ncbi:Hypothetical predicted protein [Marmota monax]|uniref:Dynein heavy chain tail domain-containing protein n=1 Tax=Marmota monax TaxID=9995 RepID=A0A5E4AKH5_MARMO|nr:hypothetical protein GHT09_004381 [Marmota monax]VTJ57199.1 Hypothetical predicted protein [Marmota monax]
MDDLRVLWMRDLVYSAFSITDPQLFEELLNRDDGEAEDVILHFLNQMSDEEGAATLFFYRTAVPEEVEVEIDNQMPALSEDEEEEEQSGSVDRGPESIPEASDMKEAMEIMPETLEYGIINAHVLHLLRGIICQVFLPALSFNQHKTDMTLGVPSAKPSDSFLYDRDLSGEPVEYHSVQLIRDEFLMNLQKFANSIQRTMQQLEGEIKLEMPSISLEGEVSNLAADPDTVETLEQCVINWLNQISAAVEGQLKKTPQGNGPLAEIEFWRERNATLSALYEQTKLPTVRKVLDVIRESDSLLVANLQPVLAELFKYHIEASDNVRFLSTVERHFKVRPVLCLTQSALGGGCHM